MTDELSTKERKLFLHLLCRHELSSECHDAQPEPLLWNLLRSLLHLFSLSLLSGRASCCCALIDDHVVRRWACFLADCCCVSLLSPQRCQPVQWLAVCPPQPQPQPQPHALSLPFPSLMNCVRSHIAARISCALQTLTSSKNEVIVFSRLLPPHSASSSLLEEPTLSGLLLMACLILTTLCVHCRC